MNNSQCFFQSHFSITECVETEFIKKWKMFPRNKLGVKYDTEGKINGWIFPSDTSIIMASWFEMTQQFVRKRITAKYKNFSIWLLPFGDIPEWFVVVGSYLLHYHCKIFTRKIYLLIYFFLCKIWVFKQPQKSTRISNCSNFRNGKEILRFWS